MENLTTSPSKPRGKLTLGPKCRSQSDEPLEPDLQSMASKNQPWRNVIWGTPKKWVHRRGVTWSHQKRSWVAFKQPRRRKDSCSNLAAQTSVQQPPGASESHPSMLRCPNRKRTPPCLWCSQRGYPWKSQGKPKETPQPNGMSLRMGGLGGTLRLLPSGIVPNSEFPLARPLAALDSITFHKLIQPGLFTRRPPCFSLQRKEQLSYKWGCPIPASGNLYTVSQLFGPNFSMQVLQGPLHSPRRPPADSAKNELRAFPLTSRVDSQNKTGTLYCPHTFSPTARPCWFRHPFICPHTRGIEASALPAAALVAPPVSSSSGV